MSNLAETSHWDTGIYQIERTDFADAGINGDGVTNRQAKSLANRTSWLKDQISGLQPALGFTAENIAQKNQPSGYAGLDSSSKILAALFPAASGDLSGSYPSNTVSGILGQALPTLGSGNLKWNGNAWIFDSTNYAASSLIGASNGIASLDGSGKVPTTQLPAAVLGAMSYQGTWNASGGAYPASPSKGQYWIISVAGTMGAVAYKVNDWAVYDGAAWDKIDNQTAVSSVFGRVGPILAASGDYTTAQVTESGNLYFTAARVLASVLAGFNASNAAITASDSVLVALGKAQGQINAINGFAASYTVTASDTTTPKAVLEVSELGGSAEASCSTWIVNVTDQASRTLSFLVTLQTNHQPAVSVIRRDSAFANTSIQYVQDASNNIRIGFPMPVTMTRPFIL